MIMIISLFTFRCTRLNLRTIKIISVFFTLIILFTDVALCQKKTSTSPEQSGLKTNKADGTGAFATGKYRNLFMENGHSQKEINERNEAAFKRLFHPDSSSQAIYFEAGKNENGWHSKLRNTCSRWRGVYGYGTILCLRKMGQRAGNI